MSDSVSQTRENVIHNTDKTGKGHFVFFVANSHVTCKKVLNREVNLEKHATPGVHGVLPLHVK